MFISEDIGQIVTLLINLIMGVLAGTSIIIMRLNKDLKNISKIIIYIFRLIPSFCFCFGYNQLTRAIDLFNIDLKIKTKINLIGVFSYFSLDFPQSKYKIIADSEKDFSTHNTLGRCDVHNAKVEPNGEISAIIIDYYDFDKHNMTKYIRNAYLQQQNGRLSNYAIMIPVRIKLKK
jgi:hypothetical protein